MFVKPCYGLITSLYSDTRLNPVLNIVRPHWGIDYGNHSNNTIIAAAEGKVRVAVNSSTGFGKYVVITHTNGWETLYAHLSVINVSAGQIVKQGQRIGMKGTTGNSTGVHLHFEISKGKWSNKYSHHADPALYIVDPDVRKLQSSLNKLGYIISNDGIYGKETINAVVDYQKKNGLLADGVAGKITIQAIERSIENLPRKENAEVSKVEYEKNAKPSPSLAKEFDRAVKAGITDGTYPNRPATRQEVAVMNLRVYENILEKLNLINNEQ